MLELSCPGGETGRHAGLKILWAARPVRVQLPPGALIALNNWMIFRLLGVFLCLRVEVVVDSGDLEIEAMDSVSQQKIHYLI